jgi:hypothetical protein
MAWGWQPSMRSHDDRIRVALFANVVKRGGGLRSPHRSRDPFQGDLGGGFAEQCGDWYDQPDCLGRLRDVGLMGWLYRIAKR